MPRNLKTQAQLQTQINQLKSENTRLRTLFQISLDVAYQAVNGKEKRESRDKEILEKLIFCWICEQTINLEKNQGWKYEAEMKRYWCSECAIRNKEALHE